MPYRRRSSPTVTWLGKARVASRRWPARLDRDLPERCKPLAEAVGNHIAIGEFQIERRADGACSNFKQFFSQWHQIGGGKPTMPIVHSFGQCIRDAGAHPDHGGFLYAKLHGDSVGGLEANATNVARQAVRVFRHDLHGVGTVGLIDAHRPRRADAVAVQEHHDLADDLLFGPGIGDAFGTYQANAGHLTQAFGLRLDRVEHLLTESAHKLFRIDWTNAADHPGAEVFLDAFD